MPHTSARKDASSYQTSDTAIVIALAPPEWLCSTASTACPCPDRCRADLPTLILSSGQPEAFEGSPHGAAPRLRRLQTTRRDTYQPDGWGRNLTTDVSSTRPGQ